MKPIDREQLKSACLHSYATFCRMMQDDGWFDPVHELLCNWAQKQFFEHLKSIDEGRQRDCRLLIVMPRGSLKSTIVTKYFPVWVTLYCFYIRKDSSLRSLVAGNTYTNAKKKLKNIRLLFDVPLFKTLFPEILPKKTNKWSDDGAEINRTGAFEESTFECAGTNTKLTGRHYNVVDEDDTTAPDVDEMKADMTIPSNDTIEKAVGFHKAAMPLFVPKGIRVSIIVSTRWSSEDLVDFVAKKEDYSVFNMPAKNKHGKDNFSCFYGADVLKEIERRIGSFMFHMLYLNEPQDPRTRIFNKENFQYITKDELPINGFRTIAVDPAIGEGEEACDSSITVDQHVRVNGKRYEYWLEDINAKFLPFQLATRIFQLADKWDDAGNPVKAIIVEANAYQKALKYILLNLQEERVKEGKRKYNIITFTSDRNSGKHLRIRSMQPSFEQKRIFFLKGSLSDQTESQLEQYPNGHLVDTIDSWSMHSKYWRQDSFDRPEIDDRPKENTFEAACEEIRKRNQRSNYGLEYSDKFDFYGLERSI